MPDRPGPPDLTDLLELAVSLARDAGALLLEGRASTRSDVATKTSATDMVTDMDRASEALITDGLARARPDDGILAEEGTSRPGSSGVRWVIDPLDGTTNYLYGHPTFAVSIAAELDGRTVVGVVASPAHGEIFTAVAGGGAHAAGGWSFGGGERLAVSGATDLASALVATGFSYVAERRAAQGRIVSRLLPSVRDVRRLGAAALDLCWVASGRVDAYYESGLQPWDLAAGALIAAEAGASVVGIDGPERPFERGDGPERPFERGDGPERPFERGGGPERPFERGGGPERPLERGDGPVPRSGSVLAATPALVNPLRRLLSEPVGP